MMQSQVHSRVPEFLYYLLAAIGFVGTQVQFLPAYLPLGFVPSLIGFVKDSVANPASTFLLVDVLVLATAAFIWMFGEARRLAMRGAWFYFVGSLLIGVSTFMPLFFAMRERRLRYGTPSGPWALQGADWLGVGLGILLCVAAMAYSLSRIPG